jgi:hypothetical protein
MMKYKISLDDVLGGTDDIRIANAVRKLTMADHTNTVFYADIVDVHVLDASVELSIEASTINTNSFEQQIRNLHGIKLERLS